MNKEQSTKITELARLASNDTPAPRRVRAGYRGSISPALRRREKVRRAAINEAARLAGDLVDIHGWPLDAAVSALSVALCLDIEQAHRVHDRLNTEEHRREHLAD